VVGDQAVTHGPAFRDAGDGEKDRESRRTTMPESGPSTRRASRAHRHLPFELYLALRYLRFHRGRTFLSVITSISVAGVTVGTAALVIALSLMSGFVEDVRERIHSGSAHLTVMSLRSGNLFDGADELRARVEAVEGVFAAGPVLFTHAMLKREDVDRPAFSELEGIDPTSDARVTLEPGEPDPFPVLARAASSGRAGIVLGEQLAERLGAFTGDMIRVFVPRATLAPWGPMPVSHLFEVVGTYRSEHFQEDLQRAYIHIDSASTLLRLEGQTSWLEVRLDELRRLEEMKSRIKEELGADWFVVDLIEQNQDLIKALNTEKLFLFLAIGLIVVVAALNIVSTLILMVNDKIKEIGTLSAMGALPRGIARVFILQGLVIGVVGTTIGLALGTTAAFVLDRFEVIKLNPEVYYLTHVPLTPRPLDLALVGAAALLISFLATIYPAWKAAKLDPVEAIRYE
jgi:lipoprotein-releasing system permease protein